MIVMSITQPKVIEHLMSITYKDSNIYQELMTIITELMKDTQGTKIILQIEA